MDELIIDYGLSKAKRITHGTISAYLLLFSLFFAVSEGIDSQFSFLFFCSLIGVVSSAILLLSNSLWIPDPVLLIDNKEIRSNPISQRGITVEWSTVSAVNIGVSYVLFAINGGGVKEQKLDFSYLTYNDLKLVKSKIIELSEYKRIPYHND